MKVDNELTRFRHADHPRPVTRRQFLGQGFLSGAAMVMSPTLFGLLRGSDARAQAASCGLSAGSGKIPFLCFDLGGGASIPGANVLVGGPGGQLDPLSIDGYVKLGIPVDQLPTDPLMVNEELGLRFHSDSAFLRGILSVTSDTTRANVNGTLLCARSDNDTGNNPHNPMYGINRAGASGDLAVLIGTRSSESGGRSVAPPSLIDPTVRPVKVDNPGDVTGLVDTGKLVDLLAPEDAASVMSAVEQLSELKLQKMTEDAILEELIRCSYVESTDKVANFGNPALLDPRNDPLLTAILSEAALDIDQSEFRKTVSVAKMVQNGLAGAGTIEFGGYDYHDSTRATGERKDFVAGQAMGVALEYAARSGKQLMLYVFSDGSVVSDGVIDNSADGRGKPIWKSDNSGTAGVFILVYDPTGRPQLVAPERQQIGHFRSSGSNETGATRISNNVEQLVQAVVLNYLALHDELGLFESVLPNHGLGGAAERDQLVAFQPIRSTV